MLGYTKCYKENTYLLRKTQMSYLICMYSISYLGLYIAVLVMEVVCDPDTCEDAFGVQKLSLCIGSSVRTRVKFTC